MMKLKKLAPFALVAATAWVGIFCLPALLRAQSVGVEAGNVIFTNATGRQAKLTATGRDSAPNLAPDGRRVVFVRATPGQLVATGSGEEEAIELWLIETNGKNATLLVRGASHPQPENVLAGMQAPQFAPDGKRIFFLSAAWATSGAVHTVDPMTKKVAFVCAGNDLEVIRRGEYRGHLIVQQHRYFLGGGSFDWHWLLKPDGKEVGPIGEETQMFKETYLHD